VSGLNCRAQDKKAKARGSSKVFISKIILYTLQLNILDTLDCPMERVISIIDALLRGRMYIELPFFGQMIMNFISLYQVPMQLGGIDISIVEPIAQNRLISRILTF